MHRVDVIDLARGVALLAMAVFHFAWDLEFFGYAEPGMTQQFGWKLFARSIAATFLVLVGFSLFLAHREGIRWRGFLGRLARIAAAAALITLATWYATPDRFIFFGILHQIALASLLGLAFLRLPSAALVALAIAWLAAPNFLRGPLFDHPALWWVGLAPQDPLSNDYVPLFPWFGAVLLGIAAARTAYSSGLLARLGKIRAGGWAWPIRLAGRHGLAFYLLHQPLLIAALWLYTALVPAASREAAFARSCQQSCIEVGEAEYCAAYCQCVLDALASSGILDDLSAGGSDAELNGVVNDATSRCQASLEGETKP